MDVAKLYSGPNFIFGCDPEFFFEKEGQIIGAEKVIPEEGLSRHHPGTPKGSEEARTGKLILDGVQCELNPSPSCCRAGLGMGVSAAFKILLEELKKREQEHITVSFKTVVEVPEEEFNSLNERAKKLGCKPSFNVYGNGSAKLAEITEDYRGRSGSGHIHIGLDVTSSPWMVFKNYKWQPDRKKYPTHRLVPLLDVLVGNTCVLLDRNPLNVERRKLYGLAGEYREPPWGVEYRTLSNFWLRAYPLLSLVTGLCRMAGGVLMPASDVYEKALLSKVDLREVSRAINENDFELASKNWEGVKEWIREYVSDNALAGYAGHGFPLNPDTLEDFDYFVAKGLDHWFKEDPVEHWCGFQNSDQLHKQGWETMLLNTIRKERLQDGK